MAKHPFSRRDLLKASAVLFAAPTRAAAPEATAITPALIEAAKKEGKVHLNRPAAGREDREIL